MTKVYLDTETCGLHGFVVLIQYAVEDGPIELYEVWKHPVSETLRLIEWLASHTVVGFNLAFDWFHLCKCYTVFQLCDPSWVPEEHIDEIANLEEAGKDGPCLKPVGALDLLLHSRKGPFQSLMARDDIRIRRVPISLADALADELENRVEIDGIYFARKKDKDAPRWSVFDRKKRNGDPDPDFKDVVLRFAPAGGLKFLAEHALGYKPKYHFQDVEPDRKPKELGYAPTAAAVALNDKWEVFKNKKCVGHAWPAIIKEHIDHWHTRPDARKYANDDVVITRDLDKYFNFPAPDDDDSVLACMVAAVRWHGFTVDLDGIQRLLADAEAVMRSSPVNINQPPKVRRYLYECMDDTEKFVIEESTRKANLEAVATWTVDEDEVCTKCDGKGCARCDNGILRAGKHPAAIRADRVLTVKAAAKERELYRKLVRAKRFHASFNVIGALSSRMSGGDGLNAQGIKHTEIVRSQFPLAWAGMRLSIGDFDSFEVSIAVRVTGDESLQADLLNGKKIHAIFGSMMYPTMSYEDILETAGTNDDRYTKGKQGFFASILYGGNHLTLARKLGVNEEDGKAAIEKLLKKYRDVNAWRVGIAKAFQSMTQPEGLGKRIYWNTPPDYCESFLGFRRYYTLENKICEALYTLARKLPKEWQKNNVKCVRSNRVQYATGAVSSALFGAAFGLQSANVRSAANHQIQSPGAQLTKRAQRLVWDLQPSGVGKWCVAPMQIHDEIVAVTSPEYVQPVADCINSTVESFKEKVPLIGMTWKANVNSWGDK